MKGEQCGWRRGWRRGCLFVLILLAATESRAKSQEPIYGTGALFPTFGTETTNLSAPGNTAASSSGIVPVGCSSCGDSLLTSSPPPPALEGDGIPCAQGCGCAQCYPGQIPCDCCGDSKTCLGRFVGGLYKCICCPDPCYVSTWRPLANNAFFIDQVKPVTQMTILGDFGQDYTFPDKAEYFWAAENGKGPHLPASAAPVLPGTTATGAKIPGLPTTGPALPGVPNPRLPGEPSLNYGLGVLYFEGAIQRFSMFIGLPYRNVEPTLYPGASGFSDMFVGTKSLLLDCELIQFSWIFKVFIPTGNFTAGLGTGHVAFQPELVTAIKLTPITYFQAQTFYWWPVGGSMNFQGPVWNWQLAVNQLLWHCGCEKSVDVIGSAELGGYEIAGGAYTAPITGTALSAKDIGNIVNVGPGIRVVICRKIDLGFGSQFAISKDRMAGDLERVEFRWRF